MQKSLKACLVVGWNIMERQALLDYAKQVSTRESIVQSKTLHFTQKLEDYPSSNERVSGHNPKVFLYESTCKSLPSKANKSLRASKQWENALHHTSCQLDGTPKMQRENNTGEVNDKQRRSV